MSTLEVTHTDGISAAKAWAKANGWGGRKGGWIYNRQGEPICQGWAALTGRLVRHHLILDPMGGQMATRSDDPQGRRNVFDGGPVILVDAE